MTFEKALEILKERNILRITISGDIGAGKSTFAKNLAQLLDVPRVYIGQFMREEAKERGISLDELNALLEKDDEIDRKMDALQREKAREIEKGVFEGRTSWYFVENPDVRMFFSVRPKVAAERIWDDENDLRDRYESIEKLMVANDKRKASEVKRYENYYGIDVYDEDNFDIIIDTSDIGVEEVLKEGIIELAKFLGR